MTGACRRLGAAVVRALALGAAAIDPRHRPLFDRLQRLVLEAHPDATVVLSYQIPT